jgi:hypothetical protein
MEGVISKKLPGFENFPGKSGMDHFTSTVI